MKQNKQLFGIALTIVLLTVTTFLLRDFNMSWVEVSGHDAKITLNFILPMDQDALQDKITIQSSKVYDSKFASYIEWTSDHTCIIYLKELGPVMGQEVVLKIDNAPTTYQGISKNASIPIQFQSDVMIVAPTEEILVTTTKPFIVQFNTPMNANTLSKYLQSDATFLIEPLEGTNLEGDTYKDETKFLFTPKKPLLNDHKYLLSFRKGMTSQSGNLLETPIQLQLQTDSKPTITNVIPASGSKWVGLYPRISIETDEVVETGYLEMNGELVEGIKKNDHRIDFYPPHVLAPDAQHNFTLHVQTPSGEVSNPYAMHFRTSPVNDERIWGELILGELHQLRIYQGEKEIHRIICSGGKSETPTPVGTYYLKGKLESYYDDTLQEGANYTLQFSEGLLLHGMARDAHWNMKENVHLMLGKGQTAGSIVMSEEDAQWLYDHAPDDMMLIIHS